eukprot:6398072-Amphidinium_carterae.1
MTKFRSLHGAMERERRHFVGHFRPYKFLRPISDTSTFKFFTNDRMYLLLEANVHLLTSLHKGTMT